MATFKDWSEYTAKEKKEIQSESKARGVSEVYILTERATLCAIEVAKEKAIAEIKLAKAELI